MKQRKWIVAGIFLAGICAATAQLRFAEVVKADDAKPAAKTEPWKAEDVIFQEFVTQMRISPDDKWLVWVKSTCDKEKDARVSNLYLSSLTEAKEIELTRGSDRYGNPRWSPDGERIAFVSSRARPQPKPDTAPMQIWLINPHGGEPWVLTELARAPRQFEWLDKDTIIYSAEEEPALAAIHLGLRLLGVRARREAALDLGGLFVANPDRGGFERKRPARDGDCGAVLYASPSVRGRRQSRSICRHARSVTSSVSGLHWFPGSTPGEFRLGP